MKKLLSLIVCLSLFAPLAFADRYDRESGRPGHVEKSGVTSDTQVLTRPCELYALTVSATTAGATVAIYDKASTPTDTEKSDGTNLAAEASEATQYDSKREVFDPPIQINNGLYLDLTNCAGAIVEYR
jgi:hypothetical protein